MKNHGQIDWINSITLITTPIIAILGTALYWYHFGFLLEDILLLVLMYSAIGLSITAGYHRYFSHKTYDCHWSIQLFYLLFGAAAFQNSALEWSAQHRIHHRQVDTNKDPYNAQKGFFWSHMGWIFFKARPDPDFKTVRDLQKKPLVMWQHKYCITIGLTIGIAVPTIIGYFYGSAWGGFLIGGVLRLVLLHHTTFLINSAAHYFGSQPYSDKSSARDSWWLALFTFGEGYHNFHHTFQGDYRNGIRKYHWDPSKWFISCLSFVKLTSKLRRTPELSIARARLQMAQKTTEPMLKNLPQQLAESMRYRREQLQAQIEAAAFELTRTRKRYVNLRNNRVLRRNPDSKKMRQELKVQLAQYKKHMQQAWMEYQEFMSTIQIEAAT